METVMQSPAVDFNFDSGCTTPYISAPSSPQRFGCRVGGAFRGISAADPERPGTSKYKNDNEDDDDVNEDNNDNNDDYDDKYVFEFSGPLEKTCFSSADELFDSGKIKPLKPPSLPRHDGKTSDFSKHHRKIHEEQQRRQQHCNKPVRGREVPRSNPRHKAARSLSPFRASDLLSDRKQEHTNNNNRCLSSPSSSFSFITNMLSGKWKLKDLLLFRSASEGRESCAQKMKKYTTTLNKNENEEDKIRKLRKKRNKSLEDLQWSFGSIDESERLGSGSGPGPRSISRRRGPVSAQEVHYAMMNPRRTGSDQVKRKTFLPYNRGLLGCLGFNPSVHELSCRSFASTMSMPRS